MQYSLQLPHLPTPTPTRHVLAHAKRGKNRFKKGNKQRLKKQSTKKSASPPTPTPPAPPPTTDDPYLDPPTESERLEALGSDKRRYATAPVVPTPGITGTSVRADLVRDALSTQDFSGIAGEKEFDSRLVELSDLQGVYKKERLIKRAKKQRAVDTPDYDDPQSLVDTLKQATGVEEPEEYKAVQSGPGQWFVGGVTVAVIAVFVWAATFGDFGKSDEPGAKTKLLLTVEEQKQYKEDRDGWAKVLKKDPGNEKARVGEARAILGLREISEAGKKLKDIVQDFPKDIEAHTLYGDVLLEQKKWEDAAEQYLYYLQQPKKKNLFIAARYTYALSKAGQTTKALAFIDAYRTGFPETPLSEQATSYTKPPMFNTPTEGGAEEGEGGEGGELGPGLSEELMKQREAEVAEALKAAEEQQEVGALGGVINPQGTNVPEALKKSAQLEEQIRQFGGVEGEEEEGDEEIEQEEVNVKDVEYIRMPQSQVEVELIRAKIFSLEKGGAGQDKAIAIYDKLIKERPDDFRPYLAKGVIQRAKQEYSEAERTFIDGRYKAVKEARSSVLKLIQRAK